MAMDEAVTLPSFMDPECFALRFDKRGADGSAHAVQARGGGGGLGDAAPMNLTTWLRSPRHAYAYVPLASGSMAAAQAAQEEGSAIRMTFRQRASGESEERAVPLRTAAMWLGDALVALRAGQRYLMDANVGRHESAPPESGRSLERSPPWSVEVLPNGASGGEEVGAEGPEVSSVCRMALSM